MLNWKVSLAPFQTELLRVLGINPNVFSEGFKPQPPVFVSFPHFGKAFVSESGFLYLAFSLCQQPFAKAAQGCRLRCLKVFRPCFCDRSSVLAAG